MTISSATSRIAYTGDGATTAFSIPFYFQANADIVVYSNSVLQVLGTDYNLTGATLAAGGTCTFVTAPTTAYSIAIYRDPPITQTTSYNNNDPFPAKSHEMALDKAATIDQRTRDIATRSLHIPDSETAAAAATTLAAAATRANKLLGFDTDGALQYVVGPTYVASTATGVALVDSKVTAQVTTFAVSVNIIRTFGNAAAGDGGGATYKRGIISSPSPFQSADGAYWTLATAPTEVIDPTAIPNNAVTYARMQDVAASSLVGNPTAGSTDPSGITLGSGLAFSGTTVNTVYVPPPQGYLTLLPDTPVHTADVISSTVVFYTNLIGNLVPIYNGSAFVLTATGANQSLTLTASHLASNIYDLYIINDSGTVRLVTGVTWSAGTSGSITAGSCARGTGASGSELQRVSGIWTNKVSTTMRYGASTTTVAANQGTYLGSLFIDSVAGQVTCHTSYGQSRKWGLWNAYNRRPLILKAGDSTASWTYTTATVRSSNNATANSLSIFSGLAEEPYDLSTLQRMDPTSGTTSFTEANSGIGFNVTNAFSGKVGYVKSNVGAGPVSIVIGADGSGRYIAPPSLGINTITMCESTPTLGSSGSVTYYGTETKMLLSALWRG